MCLCVQPSATAKALLQLKINMLSWLFSSLSTDCDDDAATTDMTHSEPQQQPVSGNVYGNVNNKQKFAENLGFWSRSITWNV